MNKFRIISDLHYDNNLNKNDDFDKLIGKKFIEEKNCITLIAGDLAADIANKKEFLEKYFKDQLVIFTGGNHDVYIKGLKTISEIDTEHKTEFPLTNSLWKYLNNEWLWIPGTNKSIAIIGSIFYTDYEYHTWTIESFNEYLNAWNTLSNAYGLSLPTEKVTSLDIQRIIQENQIIAQNYLNDFQWGYEAPGQHLTPYTYRQLHLKAKQEVLRCYNEILNQNPQAKIILMTHHCLSPNCIDKKFIGKVSNSSYISDLENWLCESMPNLRLVISGHVHCRKDFVFGKDKKRYIVNACGYLPYGENIENNPFNPNLIIRSDEL